MKTNQSDTKVVAGLMFRLLPPQIFVAVVSAVNVIVSSFFASNFIGVYAMSAVGLYSPVNMLMTAISMMLVSGSTILCGKYLGQNRQDKMQEVFSLTVALNALIAALFVALFLLLGGFDLTGIFTRDEIVRPLFNQYLLGQSAGLIPFLLGTQLASFLAMENQGKRTTVASLVYIAVNVILNFAFIRVLDLGVFGLALASAIGMWAFLLVQAQYFFTAKAQMKLNRLRPAWSESARVLRIGFPGAASNVYQSVRGLIVNWLLAGYVGSVGISALATSDNLLRIAWALPTAMLVVSRMMISVSIGEEDRRTLADTMRVMMRRFIPLMCAVSLLIIICAEPLTRIFYRDPSEPVYMMTVWGFRILPLCMPFSIVCMHFVCYAQSSDKNGLVHLLSLLDGVICVAGFTALLIPFVGMNSVYIANVCNGVVCLLVIIAYAWIRQKRFPRDMEELMAIPETFGVDESKRMDVTLRSMEEVVGVSRQVQDFCRAQGADEKRAYLAALALEEMAGNIVTHGFSKDRKSHAIDLRVVRKDADMILRIKDDCAPFDPKEWQSISAPEDITKNIGIRMIFRMTDDVRYQNILGLNVLTIRI